MGVLRSSVVSPPRKQATSRWSAAGRCAATDARHLAANEGGGRQAQAGRLAAVSVNLLTVYGPCPKNALIYYRRPASVRLLHPGTK